MKKELKETKEHPIKSIRRAAVPLCAFETSDPAATIVGIKAVLNGSNAPLTQWDCVRGLTAVNEAGQAVVSGCGNPDPQTKLDVVLAMLSKTETTEGITFLHNMQR